MCSAECTLCPNTADRKNSKYYALADITLLRFDVRAFAHTCVRIHAAHATSIRSVGVDFIPFVMETLGGLAEDSIFILRSLGKAIAQRVGSLDTSTDTSVCTKQLFHRTAIALWRGNAIQWLHRQPTLPPSTDGFV